MLDPTFDFSTGSLFTLEIDNKRRVFGVTYLGREPLIVETLQTLIGLSESYLNHVEAKWKSGDVDDLLEYLSEDWTAALYHDRFQSEVRSAPLTLDAQEVLTQFLLKYKSELNYYYLGENQADNS